MSQTRQLFCIRSLRDSLPMVVGIIFGTLASAAGLSRHLLATIGGGLLVFFLLRWMLGQLPL